MFSISCISPSWLRSMLGHRHTRSRERRNEFLKPGECDLAEAAGLSAVGRGLIAEGVEAVAGLCAGVGLHEPRCALVLVRLVGHARHVDGEHRLLQGLPVRG